MTVLSLDAARKERVMKRDELQCATAALEAAHIALSGVDQDQTDLPQAVLSAFGGAMEAAKGQHCDIKRVVATALWEKFWGDGEFKTAHPYSRNGRVIVAFALACRALAAQSDFQCVLDKFQDESLDGVNVGETNAVDNVLRALHED